MSQYGNSPLQRTDMRKKKKMNTLLNVSIGIVALLIVFIGGTLIFGGDSDEAAISNETEENAEENDSTNDNNELNSEVNEEEDDSSDISTDDNESTSENDEESDSSEADLNESSNENEDMNESNNESNNELDEPSAEEDGDWGPIGTVQGENFSADYGDGTVNREEMDRALSYATGLSDEEMIVWRVENGGDQETVVGTVSTSENSSQPNKVILKWVENDGWMPVSVERLSSNPHN